MDVQVPDPVKVLFLGLTPDIEVVRKVVVLGEIGFVERLLRDDRQR